MGRRFDFFSALGFEIHRNSDYKTLAITLYSIGALKHHLNEKNLINGREAATISKFSVLIFESYFSIKPVVSN